MAHKRPSTKMFLRFIVRTIIFTLLLIPLLLIGRVILVFSALLTSHTLQPLMQNIDSITIPTFWRLRALALSESVNSIPYKHGWDLCLAIVLSLFLAYYFRNKSS